MSNVVTLDQNSNTGSDVLARVKALLEQSTVTQAQIAKEIGVSGSTVNQLLNGNYKADPTAMLQKLANWLTARDQRADAPRDPGFVMTETAKQIMADMGYALTTQSIVIIHGISGVGKTTALREFQRNNNNVWVITTSPSRATMTECLYELAMELGMENAPRLRGPLARALRRRLRNTKGLIVVDEADHVDRPTLEELRILAEEVEVGLVLVGNSRVYTQLTGGPRSEDFARLFSRIAMKRALTKAKKADVLAFASAWNITGAAELDLLLRISERPGALRLVSKNLKLAVMYSGGEPLTEQILQHTFNKLEGE
ncbi:MULTISPECIES: AAA family ATPase [Aeromonas]|uniref:AAA family ATPase n=1 Tax=Aeromonas TaxID=642 RepID=UPI001CC367D2|nr:MULTISPECIES: AAA family ATPase [Aeromonas]MDX7875377.1 AAA family ATPase [Aeromonas veronii]GJB59074.1 transposase [Aeromonas caviae]GKQ70511.1 transposase [Aeromonas caviae]GKQ84287.1 transposase [Aeromonas caviae]GKQ93230.1 transposase [Aeromonas caviae]